MLRSTMLILSLSFLLLPGAPHVVAAQEFRGTITGEVTDPRGAPVEGAKVIVTSLERNLPTATTTNSAGRYTV